LAELRNVDDHDIESWWRQVSGFDFERLTVRGDAMYVLHAFQKKKQKTEKRDIDLAKTRYTIIE
jgi:phage-related protein